MLLGVDLGTSGVKAGLFDSSGRLLGLGRAAGYSLASPQPGWAECDADAWWPAVCEAVRAALAAAPPARVEAIGLATFFPAVVPLRADGSALRPAILYNDQRSGAQVRAIRALIPTPAYEGIIGNRLSSGNTAVTSIRWVRENEPRIYEQAAVFAFANTVVLQRLTGELVTDWSSASLSGLLDIREPGRWSPRLLAELGVDPGLLPRIVGPLSPAGSLRREAADALGLSPGVPVIAGAGDTAASAIGAGVLDASEVVYSSGSTDTLSIVLPAPTGDRRWINVGYVLPDLWLGIGANAASGLSVEWFCREVLGSTGAGAAAQAGELARDAPSGRLLYLPYLQGEKTPLWDPAARGLFLGLSLSTTRGEMARAVFEGTAFSVRHMLECLEEMTGRVVEALPAVGGGTRSPLWNRIKADVLQRPLDVLRFQETAALGAAVMAGIGAGVYPTAAAAVATIRAARESDRVEPDAGLAGAYERLYRNYRKAYESNRALMHELEGCGDG